jgi:CelD/BcsL family acetyltransferase involved in cellulose biosynthesis
MIAEASARIDLNYRVELLRAPAEVHALAARWTALERLSIDHDAQFFQSHAWIAHLASRHAQEEGAAYHQCVAAVWFGSELRCIWPLALFRRQGAWIAASLDAPYGQFAGALFAAKHDAARCIAVIVQALRATADGLQIEAVTRGSLLHSALTQCGATTVETAQAVVVDLRPFATSKDFGQTVNAKTRKNMRNLTNRLKRAHRIEHVVTFDAEATAPIVAKTYDARVAWLHKNGRTSAAFRDQGFRPTVESLTQAPGVELLGLSLQTEDDVIASQWGFVHGGRYYAYMSAMNDTFQEFSPGRLHLGMVIEFCFEHGLKVLELMPPAADYKLAWSEQTKDLDTLALHFTLKGRMALGFANTVMPAARKLSRALPEGLRKRLVRRLNSE